MRKFLIIVLIILGIGILGLVGYQNFGVKYKGENQEIEAWIKANNLNQYGDPQNTFYSNGQPAKTDAARYQYIQKMHPDQPWSSCSSC